MKANPLLDNIFLEKLFTAYDREIYAKITALNFDEFPTEEISGKVTGGSINVDGTSACRRTCSLTLVNTISSALLQSSDMRSFMYSLLTEL